MKRIDVVIAVINRQDQVLICRRRMDNHLGGFWEFPGGKLEAGETLEQCLKREVREELDIVVDALESLKVIEHDYPDRQVRLHPYLCEYRSGELKALGCDEAIWISPSALNQYQFPPANKGLIEFLSERLHSRPGMRKL